MQIMAGRGRIGNYRTQMKCLYNWEEMDTTNDKAFLTKWHTIKEAVHKKEAYWDHNIAIIWALEYFQANSYLEVGVRNCCSLIHAIMDINTINVVGIDAWAGKDGFHAGDPSSYDIARKKIQKHLDLSVKNIQLIKSLSQPALDKLIREEVKFDVVCVDGDHSEQGAKNDLEKAVKLANYCIIMDDLIHGSHKYLMKVFTDTCNKHQLDYIINDQYPGTGIAFMEDAGWVFGVTE